MTKRTDGFEPVLLRKQGADNKKPVPGAGPGPKLWTFSFRFWRQIEFFGLDRAGESWMISMFQRLCDLSSYKIDDFLASPKQKSDWRYHNINWSQKNIPIKRQDLWWIDRDYRDNPNEFPLLQFQVSQSLGRII
jgi:hypothetical protein